MLSNNDEYALSTLDVVDIKSDKEGCKIYLVKDSVDGDLYIKKEIADKSNIGVYKALLSIKHKNLPKILKVIEFEKDFIVIEEYIHGQNLKEKLLHSQKLAESQVMDYALQLCEILELLHGMNPPIIHRDIKPSNILCSNDDIMKLIDFSVAKEYKDSTIEDTATLGTKVYAAPEQFGYAKADNKTDIYCFGATMFQLLTGKLFVPKNNLGLYNGALKDIIKKCVQIDPDSRYKNIEDLKADLKEIRSGKSREVYLFPDLQSAQPNKKYILTIIHAVFALIFVILMIVITTELEGSVAEKVLTFITVICFLVIPYSLIFNMLGIRNRIPFFKRKTITGNIAGIIITAILLVAVFLVACAILLQ